MKQKSICTILATLASYQSYFVRELFAALFFFTILYVILVALAVLYLLIDHASCSGILWAVSVALSFCSLPYQHLTRPTRRSTRGQGPKRSLEDILETIGNYVDALKFTGGSFSLMPQRVLRELISSCHEHNVMASAGGFIEHVLMQGADAVNAYIRECKQFGLDILEVSSGFVTLPAGDWLRSVDNVQKAGLRLNRSRDSIWRRWRLKTGKSSRLKGHEILSGRLIMIESEGITENVKTCTASLWGRAVTYT